MAACLPGPRMEMAVALRALRVPPQGEDSLICETFITRSIMVNRTRNEDLEFSSKPCPVFRIHTK